MFRQSALLISSIALLLSVHGVAGRVDRHRSITFEATLLGYSPHSRISCGVLYIHQVAKYRVERVLAGKYSANEIVVDHPACRGDVFKDFPIGSRVRIQARVLRKYLVITMHPGIREENNPKIFYVAEGPLLKIAANESASEEEGLPRPRH